MVCGGFACSRNGLIILNLLYIIVSIVLISVGVYSKAAAVIASLNIVIGVIVCGVLLLLIALIGLVGAFKHEQVILFFYMIILFIIFLLQFSFGIACLAVNNDQELKLMDKSWRTASNTTKADLQKQLNCCGFDNSVNSTHPTCEKLPCCQGENADSACCSAMYSGSEEKPCPCRTCIDVIMPNIDNAFATTGGIGLFFSFTEIIGVWLAFRFRHIRDPWANPDAFL